MHHSRAQPPTPCSRVMLHESANADTKGSVSAVCSVCGNMMYTNECCAPVYCVEEDTHPIEKFQLFQNLNV